MLNLAVEKRLITDRPTWLRWRKENINASEAACLFADDLAEEELGRKPHPRLTAYELWAIKSGRVVEATVETPDQRRGRMLEQVVIDMAREDTSWEILPGDSYYFDPIARIGATPDAEARRPDRKRPGNFQVKTANDYAWRRYWLNNATHEVEVPLYVAIQTSVETFLTGLTWAVVAVLQLSEWKVHILDVEIVPSLLDALRDRVDDFWARVASGDFYPPNYSCDAELIRRIFAKSENRTVDLRQDNLIMELVDGREACFRMEAIANNAEKTRKSIEAEILMKTQGANAALLPDGRVLSIVTRRRAAHSVKEAVWPQMSVKEQG